MSADILERCNTIEESYKPMIFGWISRDFYLEEHDPARWPVEASSPPARSQGAKTEGVTDVG